jgi:death-on-curing protein
MDNRTLEKKASFLLHNVILLHPLLNGNKRTAYELVRLFLRLKGYEVGSRPEETYGFLLDVASGKVSAVDVESWMAINLTEIRQQ